MDLAGAGSSHMKYRRRPAGSFSTQKYVTIP